MTTTSQVYCKLGDGTISPLIQDLSDFIAEDEIDHVLANRIIYGTYDIRSASTNSYVTIKLDQSARLIIYYSTHYNQIFMAENVDTISYWKKNSMETEVVYALFM